MAVLLLLLVHLTGYGTWESTGPEGGEITAILQSNQSTDVLYAISGYNPTQVIRSDDGGAQWDVISQFTGSVPYDMTMTADGRLVAAGSSRAWTSSDGGYSWSMASYSNTIFYDLQAHPTQGNTVYAVGYKYDGSAWRMTFFSSTDYGVTWSTTTLVASGSYSYGRCVAVSASNPLVMLAGGYEYTGSGYVPHLLRTVDGGTSWTSVAPAAASGEYYFYGTGIHPSDPNVMLAGTLYSIYRSADGGGSWTKTATQTYNYDITFSPANPDIVLAAGTSRTYRSTTGGASWSQITSGLSGSNIKWVEPHGSDAGWAWTGSTAGSFQSTSGGASWTQSNSGLLLGKVLAMSVCDDGYVYMNMLDMGMWRSPYGPGTSWSTVTTPLACGDFCSIETEGSTILALEGGG